MPDPLEDLTQLFRRRDREDRAERRLKTADFDASDRRQETMARHRDDAVIVNTPRKRK